MKALRLVVAAILIAAGFVAGLGYGRWYGPRTASGPVVTTAAGEVHKGYHCPMHPNYHSDKPGECPICGMKLVPDPDGEAASGNDQKPATGPDPSTLPMGTIRVSPEKQQLIGVQFGEVAPSAGTHTFRTAGQVAMDETRFTKVQTRIDGWIERVFVDFNGKFVEKGQPLLTMYSPEMLASEREYLLALRSREILKNNPLAGAQEQNDSLVAAARKRLELFSLSEVQIDEITRTRQPITNITLYSPMSGYVMMRNAFSKQRVTPETELYTLVDLSRVWIVADVFENEASMVQVGMPAQIKVSYGAGRTIRGRVSYILPQVDSTTRTLKVRIEADNPGMTLRPDMFVDVEFSVTNQARMTVPTDAVMDTGQKRTVFVDLGNGYLEPRAVETGERIGDRIEILGGLSPGERIVVSGNFLIDSESQLKSSASGMGGHQHGAATPTVAAPKASEPIPTGHKHD